MKSSEWARDGGQASPDKNSHRFARKMQNKRYRASPSEIRSAVVNEFHGVKVVGGSVAEFKKSAWVC